MDTCIYYSSPSTLTNCGYYTYHLSPGYVNNIMGYRLTDDIQINNLPTNYVIKYSLTNRVLLNTSEENKEKDKDTPQDNTQSTESKYLSALDCIDKLLKRVDEETEKNKVLSGKYHKAKKHLKKIRKLTKSNGNLH